MLLQADARLTNPEALGDVTDLPYRLVGKRQAGVAARFGRKFTAALQAIEPGRWDGPVSSGYGLHLVIIDEYVPSRAPTLEEVQRSVRHDWHSHQREKAVDRLYERLSTRYRIKVEPSASPEPSGS